MCVPYSQALPRALSASELDYCKNDYSVGSFSSRDNRLECTKQIAGK